MNDPIVNVKQGSLRGRVKENVRGGKYYSFQGIPYAKPPIGELRFKAPQPPESWAGIWDSTGHRHKCLQSDIFSSNSVICGSEDCLYLNIYTLQDPKIGKTNLRPVMVWIHGGAFALGSGDEEEYGPDYLVAEDVVLVTINYRLGVFGFLSIDDPSLEVPGNAALRDQVMALKWIKENITEFGGDPNNVTIFGQSAGGACVHLLVVSPMANGLFHRAIIQSGCALNMWCLLLPHMKQLPELVKELGIKEKDEADILEALRKMPAERLLQAQLKIDNQLGDPFYFVPVIEKPSKEPAFLAEHPLQIIKSGKYNKVPIMIGYTSREGMLFNLYPDRVINMDIEYFVPFHLELPKGSTESKRIADRIKEFYYGGEEPSENNIDSMYLLTTDTYFVRGIYETILEKLRHGDHDIYLYRFSVDINGNMFKKMLNIQSPGTSHSDELGYQFTTKKCPMKVIPNSAEDLTIKRLATLWSNFARYGNPNPREESTLVNVNWQSVDATKLHYLEIGENLTVGSYPDKNRMDFWDDVLGVQR